jgi:cell shape-determining protein MreC
VVQTGVSYVRILSGVFLSNASYNTFAYLAPSDSGTQLAWTWAVGLLVGFAAVLYELYSDTTSKLRAHRKAREAEYEERVRQYNEELAHRRMLKRQAQRQRDQGHFRQTRAVDATRLFSFDDLSDPYEHRLLDPDATVEGDAEERS